MALYKRIAKAIKSEGPGGGCGPSPLWLFAKQRGVCFHCGKMMGARPCYFVEGGRKINPNGYTREHVLPKAHGGRSIGNIVLAHQHCNSDRADALPTPSDLLKLRLLYLGFNFDFAALVRGAKT